MFGIEEFNLWSWWYALPYAAHIIISIPFLILLWLFFGLFRQVAKNLAVAVFYIASLLQSVLKIIVLLALIGGALLIGYQFYIESDIAQGNPSIHKAANFLPQASDREIDEIESTTPQTCSSDMYVVTGLNGKALNIRETPGISAPVLGKATEGDRVQILGERAEYDGFIWSPIATTDGSQITGWVASQYLVPCPSPAQPI